ncbi:uncharacterized protein SPSC_05323 [Sporisorium scitamineum]|uniref:Uncharacterized protein n=1 Tax=Sporisorium scitamineum TaxID=49012 RepID=A0A0F7RUS9_9BASI|nr:hypothetical protein [Sporisorium scitamineum]CDU25430.1 uncharacterized protein SPSC_05323 [Sporisorium scitamineum]
MKSILTFTLSTVLLIVFCLPSFSAAPTPVKDSALTDGQPQTAYWWQSYLETQSNKQLPNEPSVHRVNELVKQLGPFRERLDQLDSFKKWVLSNRYTRAALKRDQEEILGKAFHKWDHEALTGMGGGYEISRRLDEEKLFVAEVEGVLKDVAKHLPDLSPH